ncbi:MAG: FecR domain-containing protein [Caulobacteraceae bacterium]|nr:FecR domain-containing protein [Caulobacteraceae bacterium]
MTTEPRPYDDAQRDQAAAWLVRVESDAATEADWRGLEAWLEADEAHRAAFEDLEVMASAIGDAADEIRPALAPDGERAGVIDLLSRRTGLTRRAWVAPAASAIAAALVATVGLSLWVQPRTEVYETVRGQTRHVVLSDGSAVDLNGASRLSVRFERGARRVVMDHAEAAFDVAHDPGRPFLIEAGDRRIRVVGTRFNVRDDSAAVTVTVQRGVVEVAARDGSGPAARLTAGKQLDHRIGTSRSIVRDAQPAEAFAWTQARLVCRDRTLADIAADLNRRLPTPIVVAPSAAGLRFSGVLQVENETAVLAALQAYLPVKATREAGAIRLDSRR